MDVQTASRIHRNNDTFREANERISDAAEKFEHELEEIPFLCECPVEHCVEVIRLTEDQYSAVRADPHLYITAPGHESAEAPVGAVVSRGDGYVVVRK